MKNTNITKRLTKDVEGLYNEALNERDRQIKENMSNPDYEPKHVVMAPYIPSCDHWCIKDTNDGSCSHKKCHYDCCDNPASSCSYCSGVVKENNRRCNKGICGHEECEWDLAKATLTKMNTIKEWRDKTPQEQIKWLTQASDYLTKWKDKEAKEIK